MISYQQALDILLPVARPVEAERISLMAACGRVLATAVIAPRDLPPFEQSMVDGYALRSRDTRTATPEQPVCLELGPTLTAGESLAHSLAVGQAIRIMTGAPVPRRADTVIKIEESEVEGKALVIRQALPRHLAIQRRGAEIRRRTVVLQPGARLTPQRIGTALALGLDSVEVIRRPRLAMVAPGDELLPPGAPWRPGKKWCSNLYALALRVQEIGAASVNLGIVPDTLESLTAQLWAGVEHDAVIILGASGRGDHDFATRAMTAVGAEILFRGVATSPGRSVTIARHQHALIFGLPGSPWAAFVGFEVFVWPVLRAMLGQRPVLPVTQEARVVTALRMRPGVTHFLPARLRQGRDGWLAEPCENLLTVARAESQPLGLIVVPPHRRHVPRGGRVRVQPLTPW